MSTDLYGRMKCWKRHCSINRWLDRMEQVDRFLHLHSEDKPETPSWHPTDDREGVAALVGMPALWIDIETRNGLNKGPHSKATSLPHFPQFLFNSKSSISLFYLKGPKVSLNIYQVKLIITMSEQQKTIFQGLFNHFESIDIEDNPFLCLLSSRRQCFTNFSPKDFRYHVSVAFVNDFEAPGFGWDAREIVINEKFRQNLHSKLLKQWAYYLEISEWRQGTTFELRKLLESFHDWDKMTTTQSLFMGRTEVAHRITKNPTARFDYPPSIARLKWQIVYCKLHDGPLTGCPGLFFSTTLFQNCLGNKSPWPIGGKDAAYHRVTIPLDFLKDYEMWYQKYPVGRPKTCSSTLHYQVLIIATDYDDGQYFRKLPKYYEPLNFKKPNPFLYLKDGKWWANNLNSLRIGNFEIRYTVSLVLLRDWLWEDGCTWRGAVTRIPDCTATNIDDNVTNRNELSLTLLKQWALYLKDHKQCES